MFVGHLAVALGAKKLEPRVSLGALTAATFGLDLLWPVFLLLGVESVRIAPGITAFTPLDFEHYPWSHSLVMTIVWSVIAGAVTGRLLRSPRAGVLAGAVVASHWLLDFITHRPDLPLWPGGPKVGAGLWNSIAASIVVEGVLLAAGLALYVRSTSPRDRIGRWGLWTLVAFLSAIWISGPFGPPPPSSQAIAIAGLATFLIPLWAHWADRHRVAC